VRKRAKKIRRERVVTDEPMFVEPGLLGAPLASPFRRAAAFVADLAIILLVALLTIVAGNYVRHPALLNGCIRYLREEPGAKKDALERKLTADLYGAIDKRKPDLLPAEMRAAIATRDDSALSAFVSSRGISIVMNLDSKESKFNETNGILTLGSDVITGFGGFATGVPFFIAYFTILTWALRGKTPGKALAGIRVTMLDGRKLSLWNSFGRAGGYAASAATGFLGFLEAFWHPNRQTIHDRIAGTVVTRKRRPGDRAISDTPARSEARSSSPISPSA
jgi:hypothetical protein